jgi:hypothetical protein
MTLSAEPDAKQAAVEGTVAARNIRGRLVTLCVVSEDVRSPGGTPLCSIYKTMQ